MFDALQLLDGVIEQAPIEIGQVIVEDVLGLGVDFIATKSVAKSPRKYLVSLDQGTTSSRAIVFDDYGKIVSSAQKEFKQIYPRAGWVEHDPEDIWESQYEVFKSAIGKSGVALSDISAIGITNQRETSIVWDKTTGKPIYNAIVWQCRRTADYCDELKAKGYDEIIYSKTGLTVDAYFSATKLKWILDNVKGAREKAQKGQLLFGTVDTYLMWKLSGGKIHATDYTNASRTMMFNIKTLEWDDELLELYDIPKNMLPAVFPSSYNYGVCDKTVAGAEIPICGVAGDQQSALFGHLCVEKGSVKNTYGTGCFTLMNTGSEFVTSKRGLITTLSASMQDGRPQYVLEGSVFVGGAVLQWLRDEMKLISSAREADELSATVENTNGVYIVPAFVGLGAPHWDANARGTVVGLTRGVKREHFVRAALESIAYQVFDVVHAMESDIGRKITALAVDGGASVSDILMKFQADLLQAEVLRPAVVETTALGVCYLAGLCVGVWKDVDRLRTQIGKGKVFKPTMDDNSRYELLLGWESAVARTKYE
ncbi:MAG: glycerol kinase GlpK [Clostridia bacterium]|nr:glycerol kinase GlpK [Clostridia bacterium]